MIAFATTRSILWLVVVVKKYLARKFLAVKKRGQNFTGKIPTASSTRRITVQRGKIIQFRETANHTHFCSRTNLSAVL